MKKLVAISIMAAMLLGIGVAAMASETDWVLYLRPQAAGGASGGTLLQAGTKTNAADGYETTGDTLTTLSATLPNVGSFQESWAAAPPIYTGDKRAPLVGATAARATQTWDILFWVPTGFGATTAELVWFNPTSYDIMPTIGGVAYDYTLEVLRDPTQVYAAGTKFVINPLTQGTSSGTPLGKMTWTNNAAIKIANSDAATSAVKLRFTAAPVGGGPIDTPEPSSMLALASGLFGLAGFAVRRRK